MLKHLILAGAILTASPALASQSRDEIALRAIDARQRTAVANADQKAIAEIAHANLRINAPGNRVLTGEDLIRMIGTGEIRNEVFERTPESVTITGNVGVIMGNETDLPGVNSEQARIHGYKTLKRRYTNVYSRTRGGWRHLARHANVIL